MSLTEIENSNAIEIGHARIVASAKYERKEQTPTITWHLVGGRTTKSKLIAIAHARKINYLIETTLKAAKNVG